MLYSAAVLHLRGLKDGREDILLAGSALALLVAAGPAMAADLPGPVYKAPPPMVAPVNWTGFYIGAGSGFAVFDARTSVQGAGGANQGGKGWLVSGFTGYDYQIGNIVAGVLGDFDWGSVTSGYLDPATGGTGTMKEKYQWRCCSCRFQHPADRPSSRCPRL
jgi:outer membrane immunogenic protein